MSNMQALKIQGPEQAKVVADVPIPAVRPGHILIKVECVGLNPTDWKHIDWQAIPGATAGCDYSGTIVEIGPDITQPFKKGDRVAGLAHGCNKLAPEDGAFAEYVVALAHVALRIPDSISFEAAATLGIAVTTTGQGLYQTLKLPLPTEPAKDKVPVLIYGGSTGTGLFMLQYAKLSGLQVITTCSPHNFQLVKDFGADAAFDYKDPDCGKKIREYTENKLKYAQDCVTDEMSSIPICAAALSSDGEGAKYSSLLDFEDEWPRADVKAEYTSAYTAFGRDLDVWDEKTAALLDHKEFASKFWSITEALLEGGKLKLFPAVREGGLQGILQGLDDLRHNRVSGKKLVYRVNDRI